MLPHIVAIGGFFIPTYGFLVALAFLSGLWVTGRLARREPPPIGPDTERLLNLAIYCALAGIVGAKLLMFFVDIPYYINNPGEIFSFATLQAGGIFYGGLLAALGVAFYYMKRHDLPLLATADVFAPGLALGHAIGRLGCFSAGCCWGRPTSLPWAVEFTHPEAHRLVGVPLNIPLHPTQLYESLGELAIFALLIAAIVRPRRPGAILGMYLLLYSALRFGVEFVRAHDHANPFGGPLSTAQWISLALIVTVLGVWGMRRGRAVPARNAG